MAYEGDCILTNHTVSAEAAGSFTIGDDLTVHRLGYGAMQLPGPGVWGPSPDPQGAIRVLQRAIELGVNLIDTADAYGPFTADLLIHEALHPYPKDLVIATKVGLTRAGPDDWRPVGRPEYLRQQVELNLRHLGVNQIDLLQLHRVDPKVPLSDQVGELALMQQEGKIRHIGLSEVSVDQIEEARQYAKIVSVQNLYNLVNRDAESVVAYCETHHMAFIPWFPLATGRLAKPGSVLDAQSRRLRVSPSQLALAWLLKRSKVMLPIPGTRSLEHLEENIAAASVHLTQEDYDELSRRLGEHSQP